MPLALGVGWAGGARLLISLPSWHQHANIWLPRNLWRLETEMGKNEQTSNLTVGPIQQILHFFHSCFFFTILTTSISWPDPMYGDKFHCWALNVRYLTVSERTLSRNIVYIFAANLLKYFRSTSLSLICPRCWWLGYNNDTEGGEGEGQAAPGGDWGHMLLWEPGGTEGGGC